MLKEGNIFFKEAPPAGNQDKGIFFIVLSQFGLGISFTIVMSFMPFYLVKISPYGPQETMVWIGLIMGLGSFISAATATYWGSLTARFRPKILFQWSFFLNGVILLLLGFIDSFPLLLGLRLIQGVIGGASTVGFFMISALSPKERLTSHLSLYQNSLTASLLIGPPLGAYLAASLGYRAPFIASFLLVCICLLLNHIYIGEIPRKEVKDRQKTPFSRSILWGWALSFIATIHLAYLPSILPHILEGFDLTGGDALKSAGLIMMGYTATAVVGSTVISRLTPGSKLTGVIAGVCLTAAFFQVLMFFSQGVVSFSVIRMLQTGFVAAVIPLVMANFASDLGGAGIGFLNSARFAGNGAGPLLATAVLANTNLLTLYLLIGGLTAGAVLAFWSAKEEKKTN